MILLMLLGLSYSTTEIHASPSLREVFEEAYYDNQIYEENRCADNIVRLLEKIEEWDFQLRDLQVLTLRNRGNSNFGMVGALKNRQDRDSNWFHHVILYDGVYIYDLDFSSRPSPTLPQDYFEEMYTPVRARGNQRLCLSYIGRYELSFYSALDYLNYMRRQPYERPDTALLESHEDWACQ